VVAYDRTPLKGILSVHPEWEGRFDLIFDAVGLDDVWTDLAPRLLSKQGRFVAAAAPQLPDGRAGEDVGVIGGLATLVRFTLRRMGGRYRFVNGMVDDRNVFAERDYLSLVRWIAEGKVAPKLTLTYPLNQLADAHRASETGRTVGKISVVIP
jgi:NADPH:quinone reductase-like Zn-dependent oxidoreductase